MLFISLDAHVWHSSINKKVHIFGDRSFSCGCRLSLGIQFVVLHCFFYLALRIPCASVWTCQSPRWLTHNVIILVTNLLFGLTAIGGDHVCQSFYKIQGTGCSVSIVKEFQLQVFETHSLPHWADWETDIATVCLLKVWFCLAHHMLYVLFRLNCTCSERNPKHFVFFFSTLCCYAQYC